MTTEEAIFYLKNTPVIASNADKEAVQKAYDMAIDGYAGAFILIPIYQWFDYRRDVKKHGKEQADEIWRRMR